MAHKYKLRNGAIVEVAPGQDLEHSVGIIHEGQVKFLIKPQHNRDEIIPLPVGGVLGTDFDVVEHLHGISADYIFVDGLTEVRTKLHTDPDLLDALRYAAATFTTTQQGEIDLMNTSQPAFTTIEYYHNTDVGNMSDDQLFSYVRSIDAKLKELVGLGDGRAVTAHRVRLETEKEGLLRVVDARYDTEDDTADTSA